MTTTTTTEPGRVVAVIDKPIPVNDLNKIHTALEVLYGKGLTITQGRWVAFEIRTPGPVYWCHTCEDRDAATIDGLTGDPLRTLSRFMILCPDCGNKRCPKANHHGHECSGSNEPGQEGSAYGFDPFTRTRAETELADLRAKVRTLADDIVWTPAVAEFKDELRALAGPEGD